MGLLLPFALGALVGSVPCAWLLVRWRTGGDVAREGSGNVGALNAARVSRSRSLGLLVLALDALKGVAAVLLARALAPAAHGDLAAGVGAVAGHDYNPWLSFAQGRVVGGKGFATAAGVLGLTLPWLVAVWLGVVLLVYLPLRRLRGVRDEAPSTAAATLLLPLPAAALHGVPALLAVSALALLILPKHLRDLRELGKSAGS